MNRGPTLHLLLGLCARLRLACEAIGDDGDPRVVPADVRVEDLSPAQRSRLERLAQQDLWALINQNEPAVPATTTPKRRRAGAA